jgi:hypothetical protein
MTTDLLPCPFCGNAGNAIFITEMGARCALCGTLGPMRDKFGKSIHMMPALAREAWNRRDGISPGVSPVDLMIKVRSMRMLTPGDIRDADEICEGIKALAARVQA